MNSIILGHADGKAVRLDIDLLLRERLLIQADSGGGKSWLIRRIAEELFGKVQVIVIDPEGEFASLRERCGYVLVGKGGETPADPRSAAMLALKLLELRASAVCDLFEMKSDARHQWVKLFLDSLIDAPKKLWHPVVIIVDEAHVFCPEHGKGESKASEAMKDLATRGRKRGFGAVFATQALGKLNKDASSMMRNRLIGPTFEDVNRKRAADTLGVLKSDERHFFQQIKLLEPGKFYALGRAISKELILVNVGPVKTTHIEPGSSKHAAEPPPAPEKVKALLPKLADLPKAAEEEAKTVAELKAEIRALKAEKRAAPAATVKTVSHHFEIEKARVEVLNQYQGYVNGIRRAGGKLTIGISDIVERLTKDLDSHITRFRKVIDEPMLKTPFVASDKGKLPRIVDATRIVNSAPPVIRRYDGAPLKGPEQKILDTIGWFESIGVTEPKQTAVAYLAGYTYGGGGFNNPRGSLRTKGLVEYRGQCIALTETGRSAANIPEVPLTADAMQERALAVLGNPEQKILKPLLEAYPNPINDEELAEKSGYTAGSGGFNNPKGRLRSIGLIEYPQPKSAKAAAFLFLE